MNTKIEAPPSRNILPLLYISVIFLLWVLFGVQVILPVIRSPIWFHMALAICWALVACVLLFDICWRIIGKTSVSISANSFVVVHSMGFFIRSATYNPKMVENLRIQKVGYRGKSVPIVAFDYEGKMVRLLHGVPEERAKRFLSELCLANVGAKNAA